MDGGIWAEIVDGERQLAQLRAFVFTAPAHQVREAINAHRSNPVEGSQAAGELGHYTGALANAATFSAIWLTQGCGQFFDVLDGILANSSARLIGPRPVMRAIVEHAAEAAWLSDPSIDAPRRAGRGLLAEAVSAHMLREAMKVEGAPEALAEAEAWVESVDERIKSFFPEGIQKPAKKRSQGQVSSWMLGGEHYHGYTNHIEQLVQRRSGNRQGRRFYMLASTMSHPTPAGALAHAVRNGDLSMTFPGQDLPSLMKGVGSCLVAWRWAVEDLLTLHGWECPAFDEWSERLPV